jgi:hypothetical protein
MSVPSNVVSRDFLDIFSSAEPRLIDSLPSGKLCPAVFAASPAPDVDPSKDERRTELRPINTFYSPPFVETRDNQSSLH